MAGHVCRGDPLDAEMKQMFISPLFMVKIRTKAGGGPSLRNHVCLGWQWQIFLIVSEFQCCVGRSLECRGQSGIQRYLLALLSGDLHTYDQSYSFGLQLFAASVKSRGRGLLSCPMWERRPADSSPEAEGEDFSTVTTCLSGGSSILDLVFFFLTARCLVSGPCSVS